MPPLPLYLVASYRPFAPAIPPGHSTYTPVPAAIKVTNVICVIEAASAQAAVNLLAGWDRQPADVKYFAVEVDPYLETVPKTLPAEEPEP